jgi:hypothetical protein
MVGVLDSCINPHPVNDGSILTKIHKEHVMGDQGATENVLNPINMNSEGGLILDM